MKIRKFLHSGAVTSPTGGRPWVVSDNEILYIGFDWLNKDTPISYEDIAYEPIPDNAPRSKKVSWSDRVEMALNKSLENLHKSGRRLQNIGRNSLSPNVQYKDLFETYLPMVNAISGVGIFGLGALGGINAYIRPKLARDLLAYYKDVPEEKLEDWEKEEIKRAKEILGITDNKVFEGPIMRQALGGKLTSAYSLPISLDTGEYTKSYNKEGSLYRRIKRN